MNIIMAYRNMSLRPMHFIPTLWLSLRCRCNIRSCSVRASNSRYLRVDPPKFCKENDQSTK